MGILVDIFDKERQHLSERIGDGPPEKAVRIIRDFLGRLPAKYEEKNTDLTLNEKRRLRFLVGLLQAASSLLVVPSAELSRPYQPDSRPVDGDTQKGALKKVAQIVLFVLLLGGLLAIGAFSALLILLLLVAVTLPPSILRNPDKWLPYLWSQTPQTDEEGSKSDEADDVQAVVTINVNDLLGQLRQMIRAAEAVLEDESHEPPPPLDNPLHEARDLLGFFQGLLEASSFQNAEYALAKLESLEEVLAELDIQVEDFKKGQNDRHFEFQSGKVSRTQKLALISKDGRLLLRGTVLVPSEKQ